jgi:hypothetical protein
MARSDGPTVEIEESFHFSENPTAIIISQDIPICKRFFCFYCLINIEFAPTLLFILNNKNQFFSNTKTFPKKDIDIEKRI